MAWITTDTDVACTLTAYKGSASGYPKTYSILAAFGSYDAINVDTWHKMESTPRNARINAFKAYVAGIEGADVNTNQTNDVYRAAGDGRITADPVGLTFGSVKVGYTQPAAQTIAITNTGVGSVMLTQPASTNYVIGALSTMVLAEGATATFTVRPKAGLTENNYDEILTILGSNNTMVTVTLFFAVTEPETNIVKFYGQVTDSGTGLPIQGASVIVNTREGSLGPALTNSNGEYSLQWVTDEATYYAAAITIKISATGYATWEGGIARPSYDVAIVSGVRFNVVLDRIS